MSFVVYLSFDVIDEPLVQFAWGEGVLAQGLYEFLSSSACSEPMAVFQTRTPVTGFDSLGDRCDEMVSRGVIISLGWSSIYNDQVALIFLLVLKQSSQKYLFLRAIFFWSSDFWM